MSPQICDLVFMVSIIERCVMVMVMTMMMHCRVSKKKNEIRKAIFFEIDRVVEMRGAGNHINERGVINLQPPPLLPIPQTAVQNNIKSKI